MRVVAFQWRCLAVTDSHPGMGFLIPRSGSVTHSHPGMGMGILIPRSGSLCLFPLVRSFRNLSSYIGVKQGVAASPNVSTTSVPPLSGLDSVLKGYIFGEKKATEVAHLLWKHVIQKGDTVVDATCGNGIDTLAMANMVKDELGEGCVYGMDIQEDAIKNTSSLLDLSLNPFEDPNRTVLFVVVAETVDCLIVGVTMGRKSVKLFSICHSRMAEVLPKNSSVRLVAFNLGYLPGGDKTIITNSNTTNLALEAAKELIIPEGVISVIAYVGHPGGREEYETVKAFASKLPVESWVCSQIQMLNRPLAPVLVFMSKR